MGRFVVLVIAFGCRHDARPTPPSVAPSECARVADHVVHLLVSESKANTVPAADSDRVRHAIETSCQDDSWAVDARRCLAALTDVDDMGRCTALTSAQAAALDRALGGGRQRLAVPPGE
jgi:hypothetical protein